MKQSKLSIILIEILSQNWRKRIVNALIVCGFVFGIATLYLLSMDLSGENAYLIELLVQIDIILLSLIVFILFYRILRLLLSSYRREKGSGLQRRFASLFAVMTVLPALIIAVFSILFFDLGIKTWFSDRVSSALQESRQVANAYLKEHQNNIIGDVQFVARDIDNQFKDLTIDKEGLEDTLALYGALKNLTEIIVFDTMGRVFGRYGLTASLEMEPISFDAVSRAKQGEVVVLSQENIKRVRGIARLNNFNNTYVIVGRFVDAKVIGYIENTEFAISQYETLESNRESLKVSFTLVFILMVMLLMATSVWIGLNVASTLTSPVRKLIDATSDVGRGKLKTELNPDDGYDELGELMGSFNKMTDDLETSNKSLKKANRDISKNSKFVETLLQGLSTGVVALSPAGKILMVNDIIFKIFDIKNDDIIGKKIINVFPDFADIIKTTIKQKQGGQAQIIIQKGHEKRNLLVKVGVEKTANKISGMVVAIEDITELDKAQKNKTWSDVARRVAHEIKNPLTPIQLSAERLKRKYKNSIKDDVFEDSTDTIVRQVEEIGRLVDEFNSFARMPEPVMANENLVNTVKKSFVLQKNVNDFIKYTFKAPRSILFKHDVHQIGQIITNLLKNAYIELSNNSVKNPQIAVSLEIDKNKIILKVEDNGRGFPKEDRYNLLEPYISNAKDGTGLGLSIVKKIVEDHNGVVLLEDSDMGGAMIKIIF